MRLEIKEKTKLSMSMRRTVQLHVRNLLFGGFCDVSTNRSRE